MMHDIIIKFGFLDYDVFGISEPVIDPIHAVFQTLSGFYEERKPRFIEDDLRGEILICISQVGYHRLSIIL